MNAGEPSGSTRRRRRGLVALALAALLGLSVLAAGCGSGAPQPSVASLGQPTTTTGATTPPSAATSGSKTSPINTAVAFIDCMRSHGEPNMPQPEVTKNGSHTHITINVNAGPGLDPNSPQFIAATKACAHLLPNKGVATHAPTITPADEADYLKGAACMRSHGVPNFPDPSFHDNTVSFRSSAVINTNSTTYQHAVTACQKLIPAGLPYSSSSGP